MFYCYDSSEIFYYQIIPKLKKYFYINSNLFFQTKTLYANILKIIFLDKVNILISDNYQSNDYDISLNEYLTKYLQKMTREMPQEVNTNYSIKSRNNYEKYTNLYNMILLTVKRDNKIMTMINDIYFYKFYYFVPMPKNIDELIYILNNCSLMITDNIDLILLALNCGTRYILQSNIQTKERLCQILNKNNIRSKNIFYTDSCIEYFRNNYLIKNNLIGCCKDIIVSCVCPTYNRKIFLPNLIKIFHKQDFPQINMELIILDDSEDNSTELFKQQNKYGNIRYYHIKKRQALGKKRNLINSLIKGQYVICFDDDDYYPTTRVTHALEEMKKNNCILAGCSKLPIYFTDIKKIYETKPISTNHATNGTLAYHKSYLENHYYDDVATMSEEKTFLNNFKENMVQLDERKTILCISHNDNTFDKKNIIENCVPLELKLKDIIHDMELLQFYDSLSN